MNQKNKIINYIFKGLLYSTILFSQYAYTQDKIFDSHTYTTKNEKFIQSSYSSVQRYLLTKHINESDLPDNNTLYNTVKLLHKLPLAPISPTAYRGVCTEIDDVFTYLDSFNGNIQTLNVEFTAKGYFHARSSYNARSWLYVNQTKNLNNITINNNYNVGKYLRGSYNYVSNYIVIKDSNNNPNIYDITKYRTKISNYLVYDIGNDKVMDINSIGYKPNGIKATPWHTVIFSSGTFNIDISKINSNNILVGRDAKIVLTSSKDLNTSINIGAGDTFLHTDELYDDLKDITGPLAIYRANQRIYDYKISSQNYSRYYHSETQHWGFKQSIIHINNINNHKVTYKLTTKAHGYTLQISGSNVTIDASEFVKINTRPGRPFKIIFDPNSNVTWIGNMAFARPIYYYSQSLQDAGQLASLQNQFSEIKPAKLTLGDNMTLKLASPINQDTSSKSKYLYVYKPSEHQHSYIRPIQIFMGDNVTFDLGNINFKLRDRSESADFLKNKHINIISTGGKLYVPRVDSTSTLKLQVSGLSADQKNQMLQYYKDLGFTVEMFTLLSKSLNGIHTINMISGYQPNTIYQFDDNATNKLTLNIDVSTSLKVGGVDADKIKISSVNDKVANFSDLDIKVHFKGVNQSVGSKYDLFDHNNLITKDSVKRVTSSNPAVFKMGNDAIIHQMHNASKFSLTDNEVKADENIYIVNNTSQKYNLPVIYNLKNNTYTKYGLSDTRTINKKRNATNNPVHIKLIYTYGQNEIPLNSTIKALTNVNNAIHNKMYPISPLLDDVNQPINYTYYYLTNITRTSTNQEYVTNVQSQGEYLHMTFKVLEAQPLLERIFGELKVDPNSLTMTNGVITAKEIDSDKILNITEAANMVSENTELKQDITTTITKLNTVTQQTKLDAEKITTYIQKIAHFEKINSEYEDNKNTYLATIASLKGDISNITNQNTILANSNTAFEQTIQKLRVQHDTFNDTLSTQNKKLANLIAQISNQDQQILTLNNQIKTIDIQKDDLTSNIATLEKQNQILQDFKNNNADNQTIINQLEDQITKHTKTLDIIKQLNVDLNTKNDLAQEQNATLKTEISHLNNTIKDKNAAQEKLITNFGIQTNTLKEAMESIDTQNEELIELQKIIQGLNIDKDNLTDQKDTLNDVTTKLNLQIEQLKDKQTSNSKEFTEANQKLLTQIIKHKEIISDIQANNEDLINNKLALETKNSTLEEKTLQLEEEIQEHKSNQEDLITQFNDQITNLKQSITDNANQIIAEQATNKKLQDYIESAKADDIILTDINIDLSSQIDQLKEIQKNITEENAELSTTIQEQINTLEAQQNTNNILNIVNAEYAKEKEYNTPVQYVDLQSSNTTLQGAISQLHENKIAISNQFTALEKRYDQLLAQKITLDNDLTQASKEIHETSELYPQLQDIIDQNETIKKATLNMEVDPQINKMVNIKRLALSKQVNDLRDYNEKFNSNTEQIKKNPLYVQDKIGEIEKQLKNLNSSDTNIDTLNNKLQELKVLKEQYTESGKQDDIIAKIANVLTTIQQAGSSTDSIPQTLQAKITKMKNKLEKNSDTNNEIYKALITLEHNTKQLQNNYNKVTKLISQEQSIQNENEKVQALITQLKNEGGGIPSTKESTNSKIVDRSTNGDSMVTNRSAAYNAVQALKKYYEEIMKALAGNENYSIEEQKRIAQGMIPGNIRTNDTNNQTIAAVNFDLDSSLIIGGNIAAGQEIEYFKAGPWTRVSIAKKVYDDKKDNKFSTMVVGATLGYDFVLNNNLVLGLGGIFFYMNNQHQASNSGDMITTKAFGGIMRLNYESYNWKVNSLVQLLVGQSHSLDNKTLLFNEDKLIKEIIAEGKYNVYGGLASVNCKRKIDIMTTTLLAPKRIVLGLDTRCSASYDSAYEETNASYNNLAISDQELFMLHIQPNIAIEFFHRFNQDLYVKFIINAGVDMPLITYHITPGIQPVMGTQTFSSRTGKFTTIGLDKIDYNIGAAIKFKHKLYDFSIAYDFHWDKNTYVNFIILEGKWNL